MNGIQKALAKACQTGNSVYVSSCTNGIIYDIPTRLWQWVIDSACYVLGYYDQLIRRYPTTSLHGALLA